jgi:DNA (cytosine-5)-methyltransferase 1
METKCKAINKSGANKGQQCTYKQVSNGFCGRHQTKTINFVQNTALTTFVLNETSPTQRSFSLIDLFAGTGAFSVVALRSGRIEPVFANDFDSPSKLAYDLNVSSHKLELNNIMHLESEKLPHCDILTAGFPCQSWSLAGLRKGFDDERGQLFWKLLEIIKMKRPRMAILENVKGLLSQNDGQSFEMIKDSLVGLGYKIKYEVLNTCIHTDIPQNRERVFIMCFLNQVDCDRFCFPMPLTTPNRPISDFIDMSVDDKYFYDERYGCFNELVVDMERTFEDNAIYQYRRSHTRENKSNVCPTLTANMGTGGHNVPLIRYADGRIRKLTPRECFRLQGFPDEYRLPEVLSDAKLYHLAGNAVSMCLIEKIFNQLLLVL